MKGESLRGRLKNLSTSRASPTSVHHTNAPLEGLLIQQLREDVCVLIRCVHADHVDLLLLHHTLDEVVPEANVLS